MMEEAEKVEDRRVAKCGRKCSCGRATFSFRHLFLGRPLTVYTETMHRALQIATGEAKTAGKRVAPAYGACIGT